MRAVVTGGAGFIGSHLVEALVARGDEVVCVERPGAAPGWLGSTPVEFIPCGIHREDELRRLFRGADAVFHLAALTEAIGPSDFYRVNTEGTASVLRAAGGLLTPPRVVLLSSIAATGPCRAGGSLDPRTVPFPLSHYGQSKLLAEVVVHSHGRQVPATILRFPSVYGPRERAVFKLFQLVQRGVALTVGSWDRQVSLLYVRDAVAALIASATVPAAAGRTYCVAHPDPVTWSGFAREVGRSLARTPRLVSVPGCLARGVAILAEFSARIRGKAAILNRDRVRELMQRRWVCDPSRALDELAFAPAYPLARGVTETAAWYRKEGWL
jgi:dihydroflavonol-4-reductase